MLQTWGYVSLDPTSTQQRVGTVLRRHNLRVQGNSSSFRANLEHLGDEQLSVTRMSYGSSVIVEPVPEPGFWVLSVPLSGQVKVSADTGSVDSRPGVASLIASSGHVRGHWSAGSRQAVLKIKEELLWEACEGMTDNPNQFLHRYSPVLYVAQNADLLVGVLQILASLNFKQYISLPEHSSAKQWSAMARLVASSVVCARQSNGDGIKIESGGSLRLHRAQSVLREMVYDEVTANVGTLAGRLGISVRALQNLFQLQAGQTVIEAIREVKLLRAKELLSANSISVSEAALACGFQHLGRFASMYEHRFGQLPSQIRVKRLDGSPKLA